MYGLDMIFSGFYRFSGQNRVKILPPGPSRGSSTPILGTRQPLSGMYSVGSCKVHSEITRTTTNTLGGSHRPLPLRGDWQGPMTSLLDPGVPWSTLEGQAPERVPRAQNSGIFDPQNRPPWGAPIDH